MNDWWNDPNRIGMTAAGLAGGVVRWQKLRQRFWEGSATVLIGGAVVYFGGPVIYAEAFSAILSNLDVPQVSKMLFAGVVVGAMGPAIIGTLTDLIFSGREGKPK